MEDDDIIDADELRGAPIEWTRPDGTSPGYVKRSPCDGSWLDVFTRDVDGRFVMDHSEDVHGRAVTERIAGPFVAWWAQNTLTRERDGDRQHWWIAKAGEVATEHDLREYLVMRREKACEVRVRATPGERVAVDPPNAHAWSLSSPDRIRCTCGASASANEADRAYMYGCFANDEDGAACERAFDSYLETT